MSENTSQGQGQGSGVQGASNRGLQHEQGPAPEDQGTPDVATSERGQAPWTGQARERQNYQPNQGQEQSGQYSGTQRDTGDDAIKAAVERALAERDEQHARETAKLRNLVPQLVVPRNGGGPGNDQHQPSWNLAEQEAASRGEVLDHWEVG